MKQYWLCLVGPVDEDRIPKGADFPMREGVREGMNRIPSTFQGQETDVYSRWGVTEDQFQRILEIFME